MNLLCRWQSLPLNQWMISPCPYLSSWIFHSIFPLLSSCKGNDRTVLMGTWHPARVKPPHSQCSTVVPRTITSPKQGSCWSQPNLSLVKLCWLVTDVTLFFVFFQASSDRWKGKSLFLETCLKSEVQELLLILPTKCEKSSLEWKRNRPIKLWEALLFIKQTEQGCTSDWTTTISTYQGPLSMASNRVLAKWWKSGPKGCQALPSVQKKRHISTHQAQRQGTGKKSLFNI